jgi:hypothetical protein
LLIGARASGAFALGALGSAGDAIATTNAIHSNNNYADAAMYKANAPAGTGRAGRAKSHSR